VTAPPPLPLLDRSEREREHPIVQPLGVLDDVTLRGPVRDLHLGLLAVQVVGTVRAVDSCGGGSTGRILTRRYRVPSC
jgi:hypothetical protein